MIVSPVSLRCFPCGQCSNESISGFPEHVSVRADLVELSRFLAGLRSRLVEMSSTELVEWLLDVARPRIKTVLGKLGTRADISFYQSSVLREALTRFPERLTMDGGAPMNSLPPVSLMRFIISKSFVPMLCAAVAATLACGGPFTTLPRTSPMTPDGSPSFAVMDFSKPISLDPPADGWFHRIFRTSEPMEISFVEKDDRASIRLATQGTASMLFRFVDVPINDYPLLQWEWLIEQGILTDLDERTSEGDDHPARLYLKFESGSGDEHNMEIIWGNEHLGAGDWLRLSFFGGFFEFPHYVANGRTENVGIWHREEVDLSALFTELWGDADGARLVGIALFCDTDQTGSKSVAYFSDVRLARD